MQPTIYVQGKTKKVSFTHVDPDFIILKWSTRASILHGRVCMMRASQAVLQLISQTP